jgi:hypothetical protein
MDLATATPVEIDTVWEDLDGKYFVLMGRLAGAMDTVHRTAGDRKVFRGNRSVWPKSGDEVLAKVQEIAESDAIGYIVADAKKILDRVESIRADIAANNAEMDKLQEEFNRRPWNRAFLAITKGQGHVHSSQWCGTCNNGERRTQFDWQIQYSDKTMAEIVADAGYRACTVCYPAAPVGNEKTLPTKMFSKDELAAKKSREERAAAKAKRDADRLAKAITPDGSELRIEADGYIERFKTEVAARNWLVKHLGSPVVYGYRMDQAAVDTVVKALAAKHGVTVEQERAAVDQRVAKWVARENREIAKIRQGLGV